VELLNQLLIRHVPQAHSLFVERLLLRGVPALSLFSHCHYLLFFFLLALLTLARLRFFTRAPFGGRSLVALLAWPWPTPVRKSGCCMGGTISAMGIVE
jgi:hypothetical protein